MAVKKRRSTRGPSVNRFILNCIKSKNPDDDWTLDDATTALFLCLDKEPPESVDLREDWWTIRDQKTSGACVGFATADGVLRWHYVKNEMIEKDELTSPRFIWMANKETDDFTRFPTSFLDSAGTSTKLALKVAKKYGCVLDSMLPMKGDLSRMSPGAFFSISSQYRINSYYNLFGSDFLSNDVDPVVILKQWIAHHGPVLTRLDIDEGFKYAQRTDGYLETYNDDDRAKEEGHAVSLVGYTPTHFIVRNSWGKYWGDNGFAYASYEYTRAAFDEAYGAILNRKPIKAPKQ